MNTSFNLHGLPLVYGPKEALYVFKNSGLKYLQLGDYLVKKNEK
jgi:carbamoyltransferase